MIQPGVIDFLFDEALQAIGVLFIRANQRGKKPPYPYATYNVTSIQGENSHNHFVAQEENSENENNADINRQEHFRMVVSISFYDSEDYNLIWSKAKELRDWFIGVGKDVLIESGLTLRFLSQILNQAELIDARYEVRVGFDIRLDQRVTNTVTTEAVRTIQVNPDSGGFNLAR